MMKKLFINFLSVFLLLIFALIINANADELFNKGKEIFLEAGNCAACHTLSDAGSNAMIGPNLNEIRPDMGRIKNGSARMVILQDRQPPTRTNVNVIAASTGNYEFTVWYPL